MKVRCAWAAAASPLYTRYHDEEWGVPVFNERKLFEMLILEGAQAGLSWHTILVKRENYRQAFDNFQAEIIADYDEQKIATLLLNPGIVRNRLKIGSTVTNARAFLETAGNAGGFAEFLWQFVDGSPITNHWCSHTDVPASTAESDALSKALKRRGFKFVGTTICYAFMQAVGMVNDHTTDCFRHSECIDQYSEYMGLP